MSTITKAPPKVLEQGPPAGKVLENASSTASSQTALQSAQTLRPFQGLSEQDSGKGLAALAPTTESEALTSDALDAFEETAGTPEGEDALTTALFGESSGQRTSEEQLFVDQVFEEMLTGRATKGKPGFVPPQTRFAATGDVKSGAAGPDVLSKGVAGAFVKGKGKGDAGTILLAQGGSPEKQATVAREELGEALADYASTRGLKIAPGDVGSRIARTIGGETLDPKKDKAAFQASAQDTTQVRLGGKVTQAKARAAGLLKGVVRGLEGVSNAKGFKKIGPNTFANASGVAMVLSSTGRRLVPKGSKNDPANSGAQGLFFPTRNVSLRGIRSVGKSKAQTSISGNKNTSVIIQAYNPERGNWYDLARTSTRDPQPTFVNTTLTQLSVPPDIRVLVLDPSKQKTFQTASGSSTSSKRLKTVWAKGNKRYVKTKDIKGPDGKVYQNTAFTVPVTVNGKREVIKGDVNIAKDPRNPLTAPVERAFKQRVRNPLTRGMENVTVGAIHTDLQGDQWARVSRFNGQPSAGLLITKYAGQKTWSLVVDMKAAAGGAGGSAQQRVTADAIAELSQEITQLQRAAMTPLDPEVLFGNLVEQSILSAERDQMQRQLYGGVRPPPIDTFLESTLSPLPSGFGDTDTVGQNAILPTPSRRRSLPPPQPRRFTPQQERNITQAYANGAPATKLAKEYGTNRSTVADIVRRNGGKIRTRLEAGVFRKTAGPGAGVLSLEQRRDIYTRANNGGATGAQLAAEFRVSHTVISRIKNSRYPTK